MARGKRSRRGGYRPPRNPAPVSGPGALSQRTDGGPSAGSYEYSGLGYGENRAVNEMADSAPMGQPRGGGNGAAPQGGGGGGGRPAGPNGIFGPSGRPHEPMTSGIDWGPGSGAPAMPRFEDDPNYVIRAIAAENPHLADYLLGLADA